LPDGSILAYTNGGSLSQTLTGISLLANSTYTLSVDVGRRFDVLAANIRYFYTMAQAFCAPPAPPTDPSPRDHLLTQLLAVLRVPAFPQDFWGLCCLAMGAKSISITSDWM